LANNNFGIKIVNMINFSWVFPPDAMVTLKSSNGLSDIVISVNAYRTITDGTYITSISVCLGLSIPTGVFIPYEDLTQEIVENWLNEGLPVDQIDLNLTEQLDNIINPKTVILPNPF